MSMSIQEDVRISLELMSMICNKFNNRDYTMVNSISKIPIVRPVHKINQVFQSIKGSLEHILGGYSFPEPYFRERLRSNVGKLFSILRDPSLSLLEAEDILSNISKRLPKDAEKEINKIMKNYKSNSIKFPVAP